MYVNVYTKIVQGCMFNSGVKFMLKIMCVCVSEVVHIFNGEQINAASYHTHMHTHTHTHTHMHTLTHTHAHPH